jgi:putative ABC transport system permease protein
MAVWRRLESWLSWCPWNRRKARDAELERELRDHLELEAEERQAAGLSQKEAARTAHLLLGNTLKIEEDVRAAWGFPWLDALAQDLRYALRMLRKSPGFTAVAVLTLALGIGANAAIFSVVYAALFRPLPYSQPNRLMMLSELRGGAPDPYWEASYPDYQDWMKQSKTFQALAGFAADGLVFRGGSEPQLLFDCMVTPNFFSTLGVKPILGHDFPKDEDIFATQPRVALLTYGFWRKQFGGDPKIVGRGIQLNNTSVTVIGVLPPSFEFAPMGNAPIWVPLHLGGGFKDWAQRRGFLWLSVIGRVARNATVEQARAEMNAIEARLAAAYPQANSAIQVRMVALREHIVGQVRPLLLILFGAVGFVLLIACANIANLMMVRAAGRKREFAVRAALGGSRGRLTSQLLTESLILAGAGGALGFLAAQWGTALLVAAIPQNVIDNMPFLRDTQPNAAILAFLCAVAVLTGVLFGLAPAIQVSQTKVSDTLKEETRMASGGTCTWLRDALVVVEIAFSLVLLAGAGLAVESLSALVRRNPGFDTQNVLTFSVNLPEASYPNGPDHIRFDTAFTSRLRGEPGIVGVGNTTTFIPLTGGGGLTRFVIEGQPAQAGQEDELTIRNVSSDYFSTLKVPLIEGRYFDDEADSATAPKHIIVNQALVKEYFHGEDPIGKRIKLDFSPSQPYSEIVGVVGNIADMLDASDVPTLFRPFEQTADSYINYVVRTAASPAIALAEVRDALTKTNPQLFPVQPLTMEQIIQQSPSVFMRRYPSYLIGSFAVLALLLAMIGAYGIISYSVSQRTREIAIRMALGAQERDVMRLVMGQGAKLTLIGVVIGVAAALGLTQLMSSILYGVKATDPVTFAGVTVVLALVALVACYIPARRAMKVDPMVALRHE